MGLDAKQAHKPIKKLRKLLKNISAQPTPDEVHDLRTRIRRFEATLSALSLQGNGSEKRLLKKISPIRKAAGKVRDMDVLTAFATSIKVDGEQDCQVQLLEYLGARRKKKAKSLHTVIADKRAQLRCQLKRTTETLDRLLCQSTNDRCDQHTASAEATATALTLQSDLRNPARLGRQNLHPYRLKVKELRNVLRLAEHNEEQPFMDTLGEVKDAIGEWHDWQELLGIATRILDHGANCGLLRQLKQICEEKFERGLAMAEGMRKRYLRTTRSPRQSRSQRGPLPVPAAITNMAA